MWGFASALPEEFFRGRLDTFLFPTPSDPEGRVPQAPPALGKVEATLLRNGFTRDQVIIADPRKLDRVIGSDTKAVGLTTMDPLGVSFGSGIIHLLMRLLGYQPRGRSYISRSFLRVLEHPAIREYRPAIILGGPAAWQFLDRSDPAQRGIDCIVEGEGEAVVSEVFQKALRGEPLPPVVHGRSPPAEAIPPLVTPPSGASSRSPVAADGVASSAILRSSPSAPCPSP